MRKSWIIGAGIGTVIVFAAFLTIGRQASWPRPIPAPSDAPTASPTISTSSAPTPTASPTPVAAASSYELIARFQGSAGDIETGRKADIYVRDASGEEVLAYAGATVKTYYSPLSDLQDGPIPIWKKGARNPEFLYIPVSEEGGVVGARVNLSGYGDAGSSGGSTLYVPFADPKRSFVLSQWTDSNNPTPNLKIDAAGKTHELSVEPKYPACRDGKVASEEAYVVLGGLRSIFAMSRPSTIGCFAYPFDLSATYYIPDLEYEVKLAPQPRLRITFGNYQFEFDPMDPSRTWSP